MVRTSASWAAPSPLRSTTASKRLARNSAGQAILDSTTRDAYGATPSEVQSNLITFNGRYSMATYDGSHFSQLGHIFNASLNYRF